MISRIHLSTILLIALSLWCILLVINGVAVSITWLRHLSIITGALLLLLATFDKWLWRLQFLQGWFVKRPNINGTWRATIRPKGSDPSKGEAFEAIEGFMAIRQTFSSLSLRLMTSESASALLGVEIIRSPDNAYQVAGIYRNEPTLSVRDRSQIHHGAVLLQVLGTPPSALDGHYWTDRNTGGELRLTDHKKKVFHDFETARRAFASESPEHSLTS